MELPAGGCEVGVLVGISAGLVGVGMAGVSVGLVSSVGLGRAEVGSGELVGVKVGSEGTRVCGLPAFAGSLVASAPGLLTPIVGIAAAAATFCQTRLINPTDPINKPSKVKRIARYFQVDTKEKFITRILV